MDSSYSLADIAAVKDGGMGGGAWLFFLVILFFFAMGGNGWGGGQADLSAQFAAQTSALNQQSILLSSANNNYEVAQRISDLKTQMLQQRLEDANAKLVAAEGVISNANQTQYLLSQLGSYTPG